MLISVCFLVSTAFFTFCFITCSLPCLLAGYFANIPEVSRFFVPETAIQTMPDEYTYTRNTNKGTASVEIYNLAFKEFRLRGKV
ncbi:unnamed protein product [Acanthoscelides obtectus]|uniref:Uncharacterized protein n=1 Tax=Acanthoscelides obtectus TaxID=200917 RepID=A0A9P0KHG5_ACAOB|nr:unnamed protein product [Acanthoscelides obtectus]CAK1630681.1 hypothetical protein AOBTE_LOCUS6487 [Acanthoscelides obtectus]